jgi:hypothetical protein
MVFSNEKLAARRHAKWRRLLIRLMPTHGSYRPELHYMRGPGPKYRERHAIPDGLLRSK